MPLPSSSEKPIHLSEQVCYVERVVLNALAAAPGTSGPLRLIDFADASPILSKKQYCGGAAMAESVAPATDPLNLMRVMPSKGARVRLPD